VVDVDLLTETGCDSERDPKSRSKVIVAKAEFVIVPVTRMILSVKQLVGRAYRINFTSDSDGGAWLEHPSGKRMKFREHGDSYVEN